MTFMKFLIFSVVSVGRSIGFLVDRPMSATTTATIESLPNELLYIILEFLHFIDFFEVAKTCRRLHALVYTPFLWRRFVNLIGQRRRRPEDKEETAEDRALMGSEPW